MELVAAAAAYTHIGLHSKMPGRCGLTYTHQCTACSGLLLFLTTHHSPQRTRHICLGNCQNDGVSAPDLPAALRRRPAPMGVLTHCNNCNAHYTTQRPRGSRLGCKTRNKHESTLACTRGAHCGVPIGKSTNVNRWQNHTALALILLQSNSISCWYRCCCFCCLRAPAPSNWTLRPKKSPCNCNPQKRKANYRLHYCLC